MLSAEEIEQLINLGHEGRGFELKGPGLATDKYFFAKVTRGGLSMGNLRDGGHIVIGIDEKQQAAMLPGLTVTELESWLAFDDVARRMAEYADPPLQFHIEGVTLSNGVTVAVMQVSEFADNPHICTKTYESNGKFVLRDGGVYVRPRRIPETSEVATSVEMRELLDLATEKALRAYVATAERAGVALSSEAPKADKPADAGQFEAQRDGAWE